MTRRSLLQAISILSVDSQSASTSPLTARANEDIPQGNWIYDGITDLRKRGFDPGIRDGTLKGKRAIRWIEAAEYTANMVAQVDHVFGIGWPTAWMRYQGRRRTVSTLRNLAISLEPEIRELRRWTESFVSDLAIADRMWRYPRPLGVSAPYEPLLARPVEGATNEGRRLAQKEWAKGEAVLYVDEPVQSRSFLNAVPLRPLRFSYDDLVTKSMVRGHNRELWRLLRGDPERIPRFAWLREVFSLEEAWRLCRDKAIRLNARNLGTLLPKLYERTGSELRLAWLPDPPTQEEALSRLVAQENGSPYLRPWVEERSPPELVWETGVSSRPLTIRGSLPESKQAEVIWCDSSSGVFMTRVRDSEDREMPYRLYAVDLRTGEVLNAAASR